MLIIAEKPSVATAIGKVLGVARNKGGYLEGGGHIVSWCRGHLLGLAFPDAYDDRYKVWKLEDLPIIPDAWQYGVKKEAQAQFNVLKELMGRQDIDTVVNACDAGREGELIFRLVYERTGCRKPLMRLWISSLEDAAIRDGFQSLKPGSDYDNLYAAALCRDRADWLTGINMTRLFSCLYQTDGALNVGRVKTPTLAFIVERDNAIEGFVPEPFYVPEIRTGGFTASGARTKDKAEAESIRASCGSGPAVVTAVERKEKTASPPKLHDLTSLQREANRVLGYSAQQTLDCAQSLYEKKLATYPRTDSRFITADMAEGIPVLTALSGDAFGLPVRAVTPGRIVNDAKVSDHHAILPTRQIRDADLNALPSNERSILRLLAVRLLAAVGEPHAYMETKAGLECGGYPFTAKGRTVTAMGWKELYGKDADGGDDDGAGPALPELREGQSFADIEASVKEGTSSSPKPYTEDTLLAAMEAAGKEDMPEDSERSGIGTPATRAGIIEELIKGGFISRERKGKTTILAASPKGKLLAAAIPDSVKSPRMTAEWETRLLQVGRGAMSAGDFMAGITDFLRRIVAENKEPDEQIKALFPRRERPAAESIAVCPRCGGNIYERERGFFCESKECGVALWKDSRFWAAKKVKLTRDIAVRLLRDGCLSMTGLYSERTGKHYDAVIVLRDTGSGALDYALEYAGGKR